MAKYHSANCFPGKCKPPQKIGLHWRLENEEDEEEGEGEEVMRALFEEEEDEETDVESDADAVEEVFELF